MSLSWRSRLRIALAPQQVEAVLLSPGRRPTVRRQATWRCAAALAGTPHWQPALQVLGEELAGFGARGLPATVVLSNHFVRYAVLPWSDQLTGPQERLALARILFEKHYGPAAGAWDLRLSAGGYGKASLACAVDAGLAEAVAQACAAARVKLASLQPYLMSVFNQHRDQLTAANACLVVAEPGKLGLLMAREGDWHAVRTLSVRDDPQQCGAQVRREALRCGLPMPARVYVHSPEQAAPPKELGPGLDVSVLAADPACAMALSGAAA